MRVIDLDNKAMGNRSKTPTNLPEDLECSFRPKINPISAELAEKSYQNDEQPKPKWESLYELNSKKQEYLEQKRKLMELEKEKEERM